MSMNWNVVASLVGPAGYGLLFGSGAPANTLGRVGEAYIDTLNARLYPAKTASGWLTTYQSLVGPVTQQVLPDDLTANSLTLAPVNGNDHATQLQIANANGVQLTLDGNGNVNANVATVKALTSTGIANATTFVGSPGSVNNPAFSFNNQIDTGLFLPTNGAASAVMALVVNATQALRLTASGVAIPGSLTVSGQTTLGAVSTGALTAASLINTGSGTAAGLLSSIAGSASAPAFSFTAQTDTGAYLATTSQTAAVLGYAVNGAQALTLSKTGATVPGTLTVAGATALGPLTAANAQVTSLTASGTGSFGGTLTVPAVTLSGSGATLTFADGTTQTTAAKATSATYAATGNGSAAAPVFTYAAQLDTGVYLDTASTTAAILGLSVNGTAALKLQKTGLSVPGTLTVTGQTALGATTVGNLTGSGTVTVSGAANLGATTLSSLNVTGNAQVQGSTTLGAASVTSMSNAGTSTAAAFTISASAGKLTFGDGTTQTTAAVSSNPGQANVFSAGSNGTAAAPAFTYQAQTDTGLYLASASATAAVLALSVNGTQALSVNKSGMAVPGVLSVTGNATLGGTLSVAGASTLGAVTVASLTNTGLGVAAGLQSSLAGTVSAPSLSYTAQTDTGQYLATTSGTAAVLGFAVNATQALALSKQGVSVPGTLNVTGTTTVGTLNAQSIVTSNLTNTGSGSAAGFNSTILGTAAAPAFSFSGQTDTGLYVATQSGTAAVLGLSVNGAQAVALNKSGVSVPSTLSVTGSTSLAALTVSSLTNTGNETVQGTLTVNGATSLAALTAASLSVTGNAAVTGTTSLTGLLTAAGNVATPLVRTTQAPTTTTVASTNYTVSNVQLPGSFGDGSNYPLSGFSSDTLGNVSWNYQGVPVIRTANVGYSSQVGNTPSSSFATNFSSGSYNFNVAGTPQLAISSTAVKFGYTSNTIPVTMQSFSGNILVLQNGGASPSFTTTTVGTVSTAGLATFTGLAVTSATGLTFADNSVQTTAYTTTLAQNQSKWVATANGTAAAPVFTYTNNTDTGAYLKTSSTTAAVLGLTVNATDALTLSKTGVAVPGTLTVTGTTVASALSASGLVTGANFTLSSGGKITFADGTTQTTAAAASAAGSSATFSATSNGTKAAPAFTFANNTDTGLYLSTASATAAQVSLSVNATDVLYSSKTSLVAAIPTTCSSTLAVTGALQANAGVTVTGALTASTNAIASGYLQAGQGTATAPSLRSSLEANTGFYFVGGPSSINATIAGTAVTQTVAGGFNVTGYSYASTVFYSATQGTAANVNFGANAAGGYGLYVNTNTPITGLSAAGTTILSGTSSALTLPLPTTATKTVTSTVATGTAAFVTPNGFRHRVDLGHLYVTSSTTSPVQTYRVIGTAGAANLFTANVSEIQPVAGSVTSLHVNTTGNTSGTTTATTVQVYKNGVAISGATLSLAANKPSDTVSFTKGSYTFVANDTLQAYVTYGTAGANLSTNVSINVEVLA